MLPVQMAILRAFQKAVENPDLPQPVRHKLRDMDPVTARWVRLLSQLNIHAQAAEKAAMISAKQMILDENVKQKQQELERAMKAANRAPQKSYASKKKFEPTPVEWGPKMNRAKELWNNMYWTRTPDACAHPEEFWRRTGDKSGLRWICCQCGQY